MKILITGIHGFVGNNFVRYLCKDNVLYGLDIVFPEREGVVKTYGWDDLDNNVIPPVDAIIHLAGKAHDMKNESMYNDFYEANTCLTMRIYNYFLMSCAKKFIFFSTVKAAAESVSGDVLTEDDRMNPVGPYGVSKAKAEEYIKSRWGASDKKTYILRPCMIHGVGNKGNLNLLYKVVCMGLPWPLGDFDNRRSFTSIDNLCFVIKNILVKDVPSGVYQMGDDDAVSTNELIEEICSVLGKRARIWKCPRSVMTCLAVFGTWFHLPLNSERLRKLTESYVVSNSKIESALGIEKMPISASEGLRRTIKSLKNGRG